MDCSSGLLRVKKSFNRVLQTYYPGFLFGLPLPRNKVPAFIYHDVSAHEFEADLTFLKENGYRTLSTDEYVQLAQSNSIDERCVLLTFDDAGRNFYEVTFPLLRKYDAQATVFVPTLWIGGGKKSEGCYEGDDKTKSDSNSLFMTWDQLRECRASGNVDVQSHAHRHAIIYTSSRFIEFVTPESLSKYHIFDWPMRSENGCERRGLPMLGTPVYEGLPLLSAEFRIIEDYEVSKACQNMVRESGGEEFFKKPYWFARLRNIHDEIAGTNTKFKKMPVNEFRSLVMSEFTLSQELFAKEMGAVAGYFAYPWMLGSEMSLRLAKEAGMKAVFGVGLDYKKIDKRNTPLPAFGRLKGDWLPFMPGQGRMRLRDVLPRKIKGFFRNQHLAH